MNSAVLPTTLLVVLAGSPLAQTPVAPQATLSPIACDQFSAARSTCACVGLPASKDASAPRLAASA